MKKIFMVLLLISAALTAATASSKQYGKDEIAAVHKKVCKSVQADTAEYMQQITDSTEGQLITKMSLSSVILPARNISTLSIITRTATLLFKEIGPYADNTIPSSTRFGFQKQFVTCFPGCRLQVRLQPFF